MTEEESDDTEEEREGREEEGLRSSWEMRPVRRVDWEMREDMEDKWREISDTSAAFA